jgi:DNA-binding beta-propeller fold protein YncE
MHGMGHGFVTRHRMAACLLASMALGAAAGCTSGSGQAGQREEQASGGQAPASGAPASVPAVPALPGRALASPGCSAATAAGTPLGPAGTTSVNAGSSPFGVAATPDGRWAFVAAGGSPSVEVLRLGTGPGTGSAPTVTEVRSIALPAASGGAPAGAAVTPDGRYLLVADGNGAVVLSVARAEAGTAGAVLGTLAARGGPGGAAGPGGSAIEVAVSPDSRFAFVTLEYNEEAAVFNLAAALAHGFGSASYVGAIPLGNAAVGMAVSPDGRWLYATSEGAVRSQHPVGLGSPASCAGGVPGTDRGEAPGTLTVIDLRRAETDPARSVTATVDAGYQPVRVVTAADGTQVWVTARASDDLLCFAAARLAADPAHALVAVTRVGSEPVGLAAVRGGTLLVVADSNRFGARGQSSTLSVVDVSAALAGRTAIVGDLPSGGFPRDMSLSPSGTLLVSDYASGQVQAIATAHLLPERAVLLEGLWG